MKDYKLLLLANKAWAGELTEEQPDFFRRQAAGQNPDFLWIGCSDSRVAPDQITNTPPGGMFLHRNIANLVYEDDLNLMAVLQYAVSVLKVRHVILCGHYGCGGINAVLNGGVAGPVAKWIEGAEAVARANAAELESLSDEQRFNRLVELNVRAQLLNLARTPIVQEAFASGQELYLHGWVYDLRDGLIKPMLELDAQTALDAVPQPEPVLT